MFRALCRWWLSELYALVPSQIWQLAPQRSELTGILRRAEFALYETKGDRELQILRVSDHASEFDPELVRTLSRPKRRQKRVTLRLSSELGLHKLLKLPLAAKDDLDQLLRFEMDRLSPFPPEKVHFAHRTLQVVKEERCILVAVQIVPKVVLERILSACKCLGLQAKRLVIAGGPDNVVLDLLPPQAVAPSLFCRLDRALAAVLFVLVAFLLFIPLQNRMMTARELENEVTLEKRAAETSFRLRQELDHLTSTMGVVIDRQKRGPRVTRLISEVTQLMPDDVYVSELSLKEEAIIIIGYAQSASNVIGLLETALSFGAVTVFSPITRDPQSGRERFHISVALKGH
jgi:general secretion pathway protein L